MESIGKYWITVFNILEEKCKCIITHPKYVRSIPGKKLTKKIQYGLQICLNMVLSSLHLCHQQIFRQLRDLMRHRNKLINISSREKIDFKTLLQCLMFKFQML